MGLVKRITCRHCKKFFKPDHRNRNRQEYCKAPGCRKASKAARGFTVFLTVAVSVIRLKEFLATTAFYSLYQSH
ncbi:MAG: hypothetical protein R6W88_14100 [Desulfobacterales bacterium]